MIDWATTPWKYVPEAGFVIDSKSRKVLDIRGWGHLTGGGGLDMSYEEARAAQNELGEYLVALVNKDRK